MYGYGQNPYYSAHSGGMPPMMSEPMYSAPFPPPRPRRPQPPPLVSLQSAYYPDDYSRSGYPSRRQPAMPIPPIPPPFPVVRPSMAGPPWRPPPPGPAAAPPMVIQRQFAPMVGRNRGRLGCTDCLDTSMDDAVVVQPAKKSKQQWRKVSAKKLIRQPDDDLYYDGPPDMDAPGWSGGYSGYMMPSEYGPPPRPRAAYMRP